MISYKVGDILQLNRPDNMPEDGNHPIYVYVTEVRPDRMGEGVSLDNFSRCVFLVHDDAKLLDEAKAKAVLAAYAERTKRRVETYIDVAESVHDMAENFLDRYAREGLDSPRWRSVSKIEFPYEKGVQVVAGTLMDSYDEGYGEYISAPLSVLFDVCEQEKFIAEKRAEFISEKRKNERAQRKGTLAELRRQIAYLEAQEKKGEDHE